MTCIYLLLCPVSKEIRYVGKTGKDLRLRLKQHIDEGKRLHLGHRGNWIRSLLIAGLEPAIIEDIRLNDEQDWQQLERDRISYYRSLGCNLVNGTEGGDGLFRPTAEVRARMSTSAVRRAGTIEGKKHLQDLGRKVGFQNRGKKKPPHVGLAVSASNKRRIVSDETKLKMSVTRKGRVYSEAHRQAIREGKLRYEATKRAVL